MSDTRASFTCPDCKRTSYHPEDVKHAYCGTCHRFTCESWQKPRCMEPTCPSFGDTLFADFTCPAEHATPPAWRS